MKEKNAAVYNNNLNCLLNALNQHFPKDEATSRGVTWTKPGGGFFVCLHMPVKVNLQLLEISAREFGVLWTPMSLFFLDDKGDKSLRLSCSYLDPKEIDEGVRRLVNFIFSVTERKVQTGVVIENTEQGISCEQY